MPAALLAFANDWVDDRRHLRSLLDEQKAITKALAPLVRAGLDVPAPIHNATVQDVLGAFRDHHDEVRLFHFGGHASGSALLLEDAAGRATEAHAGGLAGYLGQQRGLVLVFLNGCSTEPQVRRLRDAGVKAVVATTHAIQDAVAAEFAAAFYAELAVRPLRGAFDAAVQALRTRCGDDPRAVLRDVVRHDSSHEPSWPWIIDCDPSYDTWDLGHEAARVPWRRRVRAIVVVSLLLLLLSLVFSADVRHTACRAPGLRSLCAAVGIGGIPTQAEQALWDKALGDRSENGLQAYLAAYPSGVYASEAIARRQACREVHVETLGPEHDIRYSPWPVPRDNRFSTRAEACSDALTRGEKDAKKQCESLASTESVLSASFEPEECKCTDYADKVACGFEGTTVCHVRDKISFVEMRCRSDAP
jgi:CHAT domain